MPTYILGTATTSTRVAQLIKESFERESGTALTVAQVLMLIMADTRSRLASRAVREQKVQRQEASEPVDEQLDDEVSVA